MIFPVGLFCQKLFDTLWASELTSLLQFRNFHPDDNNDDGDGDGDDGGDEV